MDACKILLPWYERTILFLPAWCALQHKRSWREVIRSPGWLWEGTLSKWGPGCTAVKSRRPVLDYPLPDLADAFLWCGPTTRKAVLSCTETPSLPSTQAMCRGRAWPSHCSTPRNSGVVLWEWGEVESCTFWELKNLVLICSVLFCVSPSKSLP